MNIGVAQSNFWPRAARFLNTNRLQNVKNAQTYNSDNLSSYNWAKGLRVSWNLFSGLSILHPLQQSCHPKGYSRRTPARGQARAEANVQLRSWPCSGRGEDLKARRTHCAPGGEQLKSAEAFVREGMAPTSMCSRTRPSLPAPSSALSAWKTTSATRRCS